MKTAILGGAFNPVHTGHVVMAEEAVALLGADRLFIMPSFISPHKSSDYLVSNRHRLEMCRLAFAGKDKIKVSDLEIKRGDISYTVVTLRELHRLYPGDSFYLICGADMFLTLQNWKDADELLTLATFCAFARGEASEEILRKQAALLNRLGAKTILLDKAVPPFSSTEVREKLKKGIDTDGMVLPAVLEYIKKNHLYEE